MEKKELLKIVKEDGWALDDAENKFKKDKDIVLAAVTQNGTALEYADKLLKKDKKIVIAAVKSIIVTFVLAAFIFIGVTIVGFAKHGFGYLKLFVPSGVPAVLLPLIVVIEVISYLSRPVSLSVRLFANMMAGHTMMKVFGGFVISLGIVGGWLPLSFSVALTGLEILVAFLQAYVFAILTCLYINDALHLH